MFMLAVGLGSGAVLADDTAVQEVVARLKAHEVWGLSRTRRGMHAGWVSVKEAAEPDLVKARHYIERLYDHMPAPLPGEDVGGRMMLRYLNSRIPKNADPSKSLRVRALCVYPKSVSLEWTDKDGKKRHYVVSREEMEIFPRAIKQQMDNWARVLFDISGGKFSLTHRIRPSDRPMVSLTRRERDGHYWLSPTPAANLIAPKKDVMIYVFWLPMWGGNPRMVGGASCSGPQGPFPSHYITVHTSKKRLLDPVGWVNLDGGLPHEFWHYLTHLARENGFKGFIPNDDNTGYIPGVREKVHLDWETKLKPEIEAQGLPVPATAHEEQYANIFTWTFIDKLRWKYNSPHARRKR